MGRVKGVRGKSIKPGFVSMTYDYSKNDFHIYVGEWCKHRLGIRGRFDKVDVRGIIETSESYIKLIPNGGRIIVHHAEVQLSNAEKALIRRLPVFEELLDEVHINLPAYFEKIADPFTTPANVRLPLVIKLDVEVRRPAIHELKNFIDSTPKVIRLDDEYIKYLELISNTEQKWIIIASPYANIYGRYFKETLNVISSLVKKGVECIVLTYPLAKQDKTKNIRAIEMLKNVGAKILHTYDHSFKKILFSCGFCIESGANFLSMHHDLMATIYYCPNYVKREYLRWALSGVDWYKQAVETTTRMA